jgi:hypothetical protein
MAQHGLRTTGKYGGHPAAKAGQLRPSDRVDATHDEMQPTLSYAVLDRPRTESELEELMPSDNPVLFGRKLPSLRGR